MITNRTIIYILALSIAILLPLYADQVVIVEQGSTLPVAISQGGTGATTAIGVRNNIELGSAWEDLRFPAIGINPPGAAADPIRDTSDGLLSFSGSKDNVIVMQVQLPHGMELGTYLSPHIHVVNTVDVAGTSTWRLEYKAASINGDFPTTWASSTVDYQVAAASSTHSMITFSTIDTSSLGYSAMLMMKLTRLGSSDAFNSAIKLLEFDIHYKHNKFGSGSF